MFRCRYNVITPFLNNNHTTQSDPQIRENRI